MTLILEQPALASSVHSSATTPAQQVEAFLTHHPGVTQYLLDAREPLHRAFGKGVDTVFVTVTTNPELAEGALLVCRIQTALPAAQALTCLHAFDASWGLENIQRAHGKVIFTLAFAWASRGVIISW